MQLQLANQMQAMQDMFLTKFKKLKQKNKILFNKAIENHMKQDEESKNNTEAKRQQLGADPGDQTNENQSRNLPKVDSQSDNLTGQVTPQIEDASKLQEPESDKMPTASQQRAEQQILDQTKEKDAENENSA